MSTVVTANDLHAEMSARQGCKDIGPDADGHREAVGVLRDNKHVILVGPRLKQSDGKTSQYISFGVAESKMASREL